MTLVGEIQKKFSAKSIKFHFLDKIVGIAKIYGRPVYRDGEKYLDIGRVNVTYLLKSSNYKFTDPNNIALSNFALLDKHFIILPHI